MSQWTHLSLVRGARGGTCPEGLRTCPATCAAIRTSSPQACTLLLLVLFVYDVFFVFITPFLTKVGIPARALLRPPRPHAPLSDAAPLC